jgi:kynurenine formamidase
MAERLTTEQVVKIVEGVSNWGRWGKDDQLGALNFLTDKKRVAAARLVQRGEPLSLSVPLATRPAADNLFPSTHLMVRSGLVANPLGVESAADYLAIAPHGFSETHLDALCHYHWQGKMYNGFAASEINFQGAHKLGVELTANGIVTRGVLLDIAKVRKVDWLDPGEAILPAELDAAERDHRVQVGEGDALLIRTGRVRRRRAKGAWSVLEQGLAGLDATCLPWLHERRIALLGSDGVSDMMPTGYERGLNMPIHTGTLVMMGVYLLDNADFEALAGHCAASGRHEFMFCLLPLKLLHGTASPVNPVAMF